MDILSETSTVQDAIAACIRDVKSSRAALTATSYGQSLNVFAQYLVDEYEYPSPTPLNKLCTQNFIQFPAWMSRQEVRHATVLLRMAAVKFFFDWLTRNDYLDPTHKDRLKYQDATDQIYRKRVDRSPHAPKEGDAEKVKEAVYKLVADDEIEGLRNIALVEFLYSSGCRASEAATLIVSAVDLVERSARIIGKGTGGDRSETVYFSTDAAEAFRKYWTARGNLGRNAPAFARHDKASHYRLPARITTRTIQTVVENASKVAGAEGFHPHSFRHAFVKRVLKETGNLATAQDLARHKTPVTTRMYSVLEEEEKKDAHHRIFK